MPKLIYISGKTSTGKSTFGRKLRDELGYQVIELEEVLLRIVREKKLDEQLTFKKVLYELGDFAEKTAFFEATDKLIRHAVINNSHVVIEGAVANIDTLDRILSPVPDRLFIYFHPTDIDTYIRNLTSRFMESNENSYAGLPLKFWNLIDKTDFGEFCITRIRSTSIDRAIRKYAEASQAESITRLDEFRKRFKNITIVEVL